ncbi:YCII-related domain-containing protein [Tumidithrix helvetica PCC 7403]|uniref:YciI family protein n=1 Tax=Tumidithrix helvetica TaxID=3457545 RepID=UPI003C93CCC8
MTKYLISVIRHENDDIKVFDDPLMRIDVDELNDEMNGAGIIIYVGGLKPTKMAKVFNYDSGNVNDNDNGRYSNDGYYLDGFWIIECLYEKDALEWGRKAALACRAKIQIRPFY